MRVRTETTAMVAAVVLAVAWGGSASAQTPDLNRMITKQDKLALLGNSPAGVRNIYDQNLGSSYTIRLGAYGIYEPSIYPAGQWIQLGCISDPGENHTGTILGLVRIHILLYFQSRVVWDTRTGDRDTGICYVDHGVDTTFISVPRTMVFDSWSPFIRYGEMQRLGVSYTQEVFPVHVYR